MGFTDYNDLINEITNNGKLLAWDFSKAGAAAQGAGSWETLWKLAGSPGAGSDPAGTPGTQYNSAANNVGSMVFADVTPDTKHLVTFGGVSSQPGTLLLYDRLVGVGGISLASTGNKTLNSATLPRYAGGIGVIPVLEVTTATTNTAPVVSLNSYTNEQDQTGRAGGTFTFPAAATVLHYLCFLPLQGSDKGVKAAATLNVATAANAGVANFVLIKPMAYLPLMANTWNERDLVLQLAGLPRAYDGACLCLAFLANGTAAPNIWGNIRIAYG